MKKVLLSLTALSMLAFVSCGDKAEEGKEGKDGDKKEVVEKKEEIKILKLSIDTDNSYITWKGGKKFSDDSHNGKLRLESGEIELTNGEVTGGTFKINVASMYDGDLTPETGLTNLIGHVAMSADFFAQDSLGMPEFTVTGSADGVVTGDLTVRGVSKSIEIAATVTETEDKVVAEAESFKVDMTGFGMPWFDHQPEEEGLSDDDKKSVIAPEVELSLHIEAKK